MYYPILQTAQIDNRTDAPQTFIYFLIVNYAE